MLFECEPGQETAIGIELGRQLTALSEPLKGVLLVTNPVSFNCGTLLEGIHQVAPGIPLLEVAQVISILPIRSPFQEKDIRKRRLSRLHCAVGLWKSRAIAIWAGFR